MAKPNKHSCSLDKDIYERLKRDARFKKEGVDKVLNDALRKSLFAKDKKNSGKGDFKGYCPNCSGVIKLSTLKSHPQHKEELKSEHSSLWQRLFGRKES